MRKIFILILVFTGIGLAHNSVAQVSDSKNGLQTEKKLFDSSFPVRMIFPNKEIINLFKLSKGNSFSIISNEKIFIQGVVTNAVTNPDGSKSISLKSNSFPEGTRMVVSLKTIAGKNEFKGFILNYQYPDAYKITSSTDDFVIFSQMTRKEIIEE